MKPFDPSTVLIRDRHRLSRWWRRIKSNSLANPSPNEPSQQAFWRDVTRSQELLTQRKSFSPHLSFPENLPVTARLGDIGDALKKHQVIVLAGETGSGKTTQIPKICLQQGRGRAGMIGHTQPRRLAARAVAGRLAEELQCTLGDEVGYQVRFNEQVSGTSLIKVMTDGILLAETQHDRFLNSYDTIIIDEAHERSLNIDFLLGILKQLMPKRPDLKLIVTSATIDLDKFSKHFDNAPVIEVSGRTYPVTTHYRPLLASEEEAADLSIQEGIFECVKEIEAEEKGSGKTPGDILVFQVGERDIRETSRFLREQNFRDTEVVPLYARLSHTEQSRIFKKHRGRRIVLATNVAETSLTVPGIRYVIDPGNARISRYSHRSKVQRLPIEPISRASAEQRKGRCGRVEEGVCYRLYDEADFSARAEFTEPEILRTNLASVILRMLALQLGDVTSFPFIQSPDKRFINDGYKLLEELNAVSRDRKLTPLGKQIASFPVDPRLASMLMAAAKRHCLSEVIIIVSGMAVVDPRERPHDKQPLADERHAQWHHEQSEFLGYLNLWSDYEKQRQQLTNSQLRNFCKKNFLAFLRMREWRDTHRQLHLHCQHLGLKENQQPATYEDIHHALLTGLIGQIGQKDEKNEYIGPRHRKFLIFPGSRLRKKNFKWLLAGELVETSRVFARTVAKIEPQWVEHVAHHLLKTHYFEPHWSKKRGEVQAYAQISLYGLVIVPRRKVSYGRIEPAISREFMIREGLIEGEILARPGFIKSNAECREALELLEAKTRRRDILVGDDVLFDFYDKRLPDNITTVKALEVWYKKQSAEVKQSLFLTEKDLLASSVEGEVDIAFPDQLNWSGQRFALHYNFQPGESADGVTIKVPPAALQQLPVNRIDWLVPGLLQDKCAALIRTLPKTIRRNFVPVPEYAKAAAESIVPANEPLTEALGRQLKKLTGITVTSDQWNPSLLPDHLKMNISVENSHGKELARGRDYHELIENLGGYLDQSAADPDDSLFSEVKGLKEWKAPAIAENISVQQGGSRLYLYPFMRDEGDSVTMTAGFDKVFAQSRHRLGVSRLIMFELKDTLKYLRKTLPKLKSIGLYYATKGRLDILLDDFFQSCVAHVFVDDKPRIKDKEMLKQRIFEYKVQLADYAESQTNLLHDILRQYHSLSKTLSGKTVLALALFRADAKSQMDELFQPRFLTSIPRQWLQHYPRYLLALERRLENMPRQISKEKTFLQIIDPLKEMLENRREKHRIESVYDPELEQYRWMLEEFRVSYFAQTLGTAMSISEKKLERQWLKVRL